MSPKLTDKLKWMASKNFCNLGQEWQQVCADAAEEIQRLQAELDKKDAKFHAMDLEANVQKERAEKLQAELAEAKQEALSLAQAMHRDYYSEVTQWEPLDTVAGLISQIDNMNAGVRTQLSQVTKERDEQKITLDIINGWCHGNIDTGAEVAPFCIQIRDLIERPTDQEEG